MMLQEKLADIRAKRANGEGFTLVELLIVVVILVVLAAIAVPIFLNQATKARVAAAKSTVAALSSAAEIGIATSGSAYANAAAPGTTGTITVVDGSGATVAVPLAGATGRMNALAVTAWPTAAGTSITAYCFSIPDPGNATRFIKMTDADNAPLENIATACP